jgi:hypothetical protein
VSRFRCVDKYSLGAGAHLSAGWTNRKNEKDSSVSYWSWKHTHTQSCLWSRKVCVDNFGGGDADGVCRYKYTFCSVVAG